MLAPVLVVLVTVVCFQIVLRTEDRVPC